MCEKINLSVVEVNLDVICLLKMKPFYFLTLSHLQPICSLMCVEFIHRHYFNPSLHCLSLLDHCNSLLCVLPTSTLISLWVFLNPSSIIISHITDQFIYRLRSPQWFSLTLWGRIQKAHDLMWPPAFLCATLTFCHFTSLPLQPNGLLSIFKCGRLSPCSEPLLICFPLFFPDISIHLLGFTISVLFLIHRCLP